MVVGGERWLEEERAGWRRRGGVNQPVRQLLTVHYPLTSHHLDIDQLLEGKGQPMRT